MIFETSKYWNGWISLVSKEVGGSRVLLEENPEVNLGYVIVLKREEFLD